ncbi:NADH-quinone oxidoreductase subunit C [Campylobacter sp. 19-13652]|uniref:NADH-quinone oxidoreductase subunit C n=1 Tax=Campylobacter sp. 19-13652 TaxID=2840180 RepID=UPI001C7880C9|nr:NADH-quinone oxidoreductase subunit C [Campylobacter sp. 19-13652]BCX78755.1 NADH-quinone oxidoreductase [Campylobacter sp. 19-13652]
MREYLKTRPTKEPYYKHDRFYVPKQTQKLSPSDKFKAELKALELAEVSIKETYEELGDLVVKVNTDDNLKALKALKQSGYEQLSELSAVDFLAQNGSFRLFYQLLSYSKNSRVRVVCDVVPKQMVNSVSEIYKSANWSERETYDMFGILFKGHRNLKRILMPDDWVGNPLLKTYPLHGDEHARWYEVDRIFGKEYREVIGAENRDSAYADDKDTFNFSRKGAEVEKGAEARSEKYLQEYQEEGGVKLVKHPKRGSAKILKERP